MEYVHLLLLVLVLSRMTMLVILIGTILYHARRKLLITEDNNIHKKTRRGSNFQAAEWPARFQNHTALDIILKTVV